MRHLTEKLSIARGEKPAGILFKNARLVNVLSGEIYPAHVAVDDGRVIGIGDYAAETVIDLNGSYLAPSFIDAHFHTESTLLTPSEFTKAVVPHGTGAIVTDPHEYANVLGLEGIRYVLEATKNLPLDFYIMLPSCVPATPLESAGARLSADDLKLMIADERVAGIAELMNFPGVYLGFESELAKIEAGRGKCIDGHAPGLRGNNLNAYALAGIRSDHESTEPGEALEKLRLGMQILLREGSTERNLAHLLPILNTHNSSALSFATDDKLPGDIVHEGHLDHHIRKCIALGVPPITAFQIASINTARHYRLRNHGAIAPRYWADFVVFDDLRNLHIRQTYKKGVLVAENGRYLAAQPPATPLPRSTMNLRYQPSDLQVPAQSGSEIRVIDIIPDQVITGAFTTRPSIADGQVVADVSRDILKLVVIERHHATGNVGVGFVRGLQINHGAIASTVAHDAHNLIAAGANDADILVAIEHLKSLQGGLVAVADGKVLADLPLPIAGLVSDLPLDDVITSMDALNAAAQSMGCLLPAPFMTLSFLALSPIPSLKLTDQGLIDATKMVHTTLFVSES